MPEFAWRGVEFASSWEVVLGDRSDSGTKSVSEIGTKSGPESAAESESESGDDRVSEGVAEGKVVIFPAFMTSHDVSSEVL